MRNAQFDRQTERIIYYDFLRIISMVAVIVLHTAAERWGGVEVHSLAWKSFNFYDSIVRWAVPVFTMISGALFLSPSKNITVKRIYYKHIFRIVLAFFVWSSLYASRTLLKGNGIKSFLASVIAGHYHMWFLIMLVGLYMIVPLLRQITANKDLTKYFLLLSFVFTFLIPAVFFALRCIDRLYDSGFYDFAQSVYDNINFHFALGFSFYFVLGYFLSTTSFSKKLEIICYILGIIGFISTVILSMGISYFLNEPNGTFYGNMTINVMLESIAVFVFCKIRITNIIKKEQMIKIVQKLSKLSFGVYLIHAFFLELLLKLGIDTLSFNPVLSVPCIALLVFLLSLSVSAILNKIPIVKKYLI